MDSLTSNSSDHVLKRNGILSGSPLEFFNPTNPLVVTHAGGSHGVGRSFRCRCEFVCLSFCLSVRARLKGKRLELSTPKAAEMQSIDRMPGVGLHDDTTAHLFSSLP